jgi:transcriptional regulator with XRE-family HTH domain
LTFRDARLKLLAYVRDQVRNGELTERGFARRIGISQPHAHNVLKGVRTLSPEIFDLVLKYLHLSLLDLAPIEELEAQLERRRTRERLAEVAFLATPIGPGRPWPGGLNRQKSFPVPFTSLTIPAELVMVKLAADPAMLSTLAPYDIALLDTSEQQRCAMSPQGLYVIERNGEAVLRYIRPGARCYYLVTDTDSDSPAAWEQLALSSAQLSEAVKARVLWLGRERERDALPQRGRFLYDPISS